MNILNFDCGNQIGQCLIFMIKTKLVSAVTHFLVKAHAQIRARYNSPLRHWIVTPVKRWESHRDVL